METSGFLGRDESVAGVLSSSGYWKLAGSNKVAYSLRLAPHQLIPEPKIAVRALLGPVTVVRYQEPY